MPDNESLLPADIRADIETSVAEALDQEDLRSALEALQPDHGSIPADQDEVDLVVMWVRARHADDWPATWHESDTFTPYLDGCIIATIQALDLASGRDPADRTLKEYQQHWLSTWAAQAAHEDP